PHAMPGDTAKATRGHTLDRPHRRHHTGGDDGRRAAPARPVAGPPAMPPLWTWTGPALATKRSVHASTLSSGFYIAASLPRAEDCPHLCACRSRLSRSVRLGSVVVVCWCRSNYGSSAGQSWMERSIPLTAYTGQGVSTWAGTQEGFCRQLAKIGKLRLASH